MFCFSFTIILWFCGFVCFDHSFAASVSQKMSDRDIVGLKLEIRRLKEMLQAKEKLLRDMQFRSDENKYNDVLCSHEIVRYSRQMIMPNINLQGQILLKKSKVLIVGLGGLGCPAALYLASAGVGEITLMDCDDVELTNLHRQILHSEGDINVPKVESAYNTLKSINGDTKIKTLRLHANSMTMKEIVTKHKYNAIVDGSDNVATKYLLNDVCVINDIPLVSGSALQMEGQLTVYHYQGGPCYRCIYPVPPPPESVTSCGDGGVLGPVPGVIGTLQALETIKIITNCPGVLSSRLLVFDGLNTTFRRVSLRERNPDCNICGQNPTITSLIDYEQFCGSSAHDKVMNIDILNTNEQVDVRDISKLFNKSIVLDVRPELDYQMCKLPNTVNIPFASIEKGEKINELSQLLKKREIQEVYVLCRRGNDSQRAISYLKNEFSGTPVKFYNIRGGLHAYSKLIDPDFPRY